MATGLTYVKYWQEETLDRYFTTEAMSKRRDDFNEVHLAIDRILTDRAYPIVEGKNQVSEIELLQMLLVSKPRRPNRVFVVVGETGSGKSELCQWLYYNITDPGHVPILIPRSMIRLKDIVTQIHRYLDAPVPEGTRDISDLWPETVSAQLRAATLMHLQRPDVQNQVGALDVKGLRQILDTREFEGRMRYHFERYCEELGHLERSRQLDLLPEKDFLELVKQAGGLNKPNLCYKHIQRAMTDCLADQLGVDDLIDKLARISAVYGQTGKRPVLLIEDITTWGFLQNDLLDYLFDLSRGSFDVVIGVTTEFEQANRSQIYKAQQTITERIEGRLELTDEQSEAVFLRDRFVDLTRLYLRAVKRAGASRSGLSDGLNESFGPDLYPFNAECLTNIYQSLQQEGNPKRTPRLFLRVLRQALEAERPPFETLELLENVASPAVYFSREVDFPSETERLFKWYGLNTNQGVFLAEGIAEAFGVDVPSSVERCDGHHRLGLRPGAELHLPPPAFAFTPPATTSKPPPPRKKDEPAKPRIPEPTPLPERTEESEAWVQMDNWLLRRVRFPDRNKLKDGILELLDFYEFEPFRLGYPHSIARTGTPLTFQRGEKYARIYLPDSADDRTYPKLTVAPDADRSDLFSQVLAVGLGDYAVNDPERLDHAQLYDWLAGHVQAFQEELRQAVATVLGLPLEYLILFAKFLLLNNVTGLADLDPQALTQPIEGEPLVLRQVGECAKHLYEVREHIQGLFIALFHFRDNLVDYPRLHRACEQLDPARALALVRRMAPDAVPTGFYVSVGGDRLALRDIVRVVQRYANALWAISQSGQFNTSPPKTELERLRALCTPPVSLDASKLRKQVDELRDVARRAKINWQHNWDLLLTDLDRAPKSLDFAALASALEQTLNHFEALEPHLDVFGYLSLQGMIRTVERCSACDVLKGIAAIDRSLIGELVKRTVPKPEQNAQFRAYAEQIGFLEKVVKT